MSVKTREQPHAVSMADAARMLGVSEKTIQRLVGGGQLYSVKLKRRRLIPYAEIKRLLEREARV